MSPIVIKGIVLVFSVVVGAFSMWLGYRLYSKGVLEKGSLEGEGAGFKISWKDYGPGVAFALFGACIIVFSITRDLSQTTTTRAPDGGIIAVETMDGSAAPSDGVVMVQTTEAASASAEPTDSDPEH